MYNIILCFLQEIGILLGGCLTVKNLWDHLIVETVNPEAPYRQKFD